MASGFCAHIERRAVHCVNVLNTKVSVRLLRRLYQEYGEAAGCRLLFQSVLAVRRQRGLLCFSRGSGFYTARLLPARPKFYGRWVGGAWWWWRQDAENVSTIIHPQRPTTTTVLNENIGLFAKSHTDTILHAGNWYKFLFKTKTVRFFE